MSEENNLNVGERKRSITVKRVLQVLMVLCIVFVFCPSFLVSCSGQDVNVSVITAVEGVKIYGEKLVDPYPIMLLCLFIPIACLAMLCMKKIVEKTLSLSILVSTVVNLVMWIIFQSATKKIAEENMCSFKITVWYVLNMLVMIIILLLSILAFTNRVKMDDDIVDFFTGDGAKDTLNQLSHKVSKVAGNITKHSKVEPENVIGYCAKCGAAIEYGCLFCTVCGTAVPESMMAEAENAKMEAEQKEAEETQSAEELEVVYCSQCGTKLDSDTEFCASCGAKVK